MSDEKMIVDNEACHWYDKDGAPQHTTTAKSGAERNVTLADARKSNLLPSFSTMKSIMANPALRNWQREQDILAAMTTPHVEGENESEYIKRVIESAGDESKTARERGSEWHGLIAQGIRTGRYDDCPPFLGAWLQENVPPASLQTVPPIIERSFSSPELGYGATIDYIGELTTSKYYNLIDWKTCKSKPGKPIVAWDDWNYQMAAYSRLMTFLGFSLFNVMNIAISTTEDRIEVFKWSVEEIDYGYSVFDAIHKLYRIKNKFPLGNEIITGRGL